MPDLAMHFVNAWLDGNEPGESMRLADAVSWPADVEEAIARVGSTLDGEVEANPGRLARRLTTDPGRAELRRIGAQIGTPRLLRIVSWLYRSGGADGERVVVAMLEPDATGSGQFMQAAIAEAVRRPLLARLYAQDRLLLLTKACEPGVARKEAA